MSDEINLAHKIVGPADDYPVAYETIRRLWLEFIEDPSGETADYVSSVSDQVAVLETQNVPVEDRTDIVIAGFWAASAENVINKRAAHAENAEQDIRDALERVWEQMEDD